jgi:hypothetical protein
MHPASGPAFGPVPLASRYEGPLCFKAVMSASVKPRLAGRQPSNRGGVLRVKTRLSSCN